MANSLASSGGDSPFGNAVHLSVSLRLGAGLGYRRQFHDALLASPNIADWVEFDVDPLLCGDPSRQEAIDQLASSFVVVPHGLDMSIGTAGPLDANYVDALCRVIATFRPPCFSDHLGFTRTPDVDLGEPLPLPRTRAVAEEVAAKAQWIQELTGTPFLLENLPYHYEPGGDLTEGEFISHLLESCECLLLLDLTNVYINSVNHGHDPVEFLSEIPLRRVGYIHLGGGGHREGTVMIDSHSADVPPPVWELLDMVVGDAGPQNVLLERNWNFPSDFREIELQIRRAQEVATASVRRRTPPAVAR